MGTPLRVTMLVHDLSIGAVARAMCLAPVLEELGCAACTVSAHGDALWPPARGTAFAATTSLLDPAGVEEVVATRTDLLVAVKALPDSLGEGLRLSARHGVPLLADVDDPDVEVRTTWLPPLTVLANLRANPRRFAELRGLRRAARRRPSTVSNPVLQAVYGGEVVPHARPDPGAGGRHVRTGPVLAFIGTVRAHKGVADLRAAVAALAGEGWRLRVTAEAPADARPWEEWLGADAPDTRALLDGSDVVVVSSAPTGYGRAQLPLKLVDAMLSGRAVVVSDTGPLPWAAGPGVPVVPAGDARALVAALRPLADPAARQRLGDAVRATALARYTPAAVAPALGRALEAALAAGPARPRRRA